MFGTETQKVIKRRGKMKMSSRRICYGEVVPFVVMSLLQCGQVLMNILFKKASTEGMNYMAYVFYSYAIGGLVLLPFSFVFERKKLPRFNWQIVGRLILLGFLGYSGQVLGFKGIQYSSPTMASAMSNLTPAFTFALAVLFRMETVEIRSLSSWAKILGTLLSIGGALVVVLFEGPVLARGHQGYATSYQHLNSAHTDWVIGGLLLMGNYVFCSLWYIVQTQAVQTFPEMLLVSLFNVCVAVIAAPVTLISEPHDAWQISSKMMLYAILYTGLFGISFATSLLTWGLHLKGPVYVALFTPLSIVIAAIMSVIFLGDSLYLGSVIGAIIISLGFYLCIWGKAKEELIDESLNLEAESASTPLLFTRKKKRVNCSNGPLHLAKIQEIVTTGKLSKLEHFETDEKVKTISLFGEVWGIGPATALKLYVKGHRNLDDLKNEESLTHSQRVVIVCGGSYRRGKSSCRDLDVVITHPDGKSHIGFLSKYVKLLKEMRFLREDLIFSVHSEKDSQTRSLLLLGTDSGVDTYFGLCTSPGKELRHRIDFKVYPRDIYAFGLIAWTGNEVLNRRLRLLAESKGFQLDDTGLFPATHGSGGKRLRFVTGLCCCIPQLVSFNLSWLSIFYPGGQIPLLIGNLKELRVLELSWNNFSGPIPESIGNLLKLEEMHLGFNHFSGPFPSSIGNLTKLKSLDLNRNNISGPIPESIGNLTSLTSLDLRSNQISGRIPGSIDENLINLETMFLGSNVITRPLPENIGNMQKLVDVDLSNNKLQGPIPDSIGNLKSLKRILLSSNLLTGIIPLSFGNLQSLSVLTLGNNQLEGAIPSSFGNMSSLSILELGGNKLAGTIPSSFGCLANLVDLSIDHNMIDGPVPASFRNLTNLARLDLSYNQINSVLPEPLAKIRYLSALMLQNNQFTGTIPQTFLNLKNLGELSLSNNLLSGRIPFGKPLIDFPRSSYSGNKGLCGVPLEPCTGSS
ncbi:OLC1v1001188C1 [Oldenlandia corymbosa var. corymbosa]|uniref:OLC1v1001188C1 n=1 Tax=Oldenlandia corymbosa var. corymbosa TaxID=529605 RepID=A0AAV1D719_OLDCO|nr:OLC1v1001188C1 [Oldenlandia corymbosa var. corymbosa]